MGEVRRSSKVFFVFDGLPGEDGPCGPRLIEVENESGLSVKCEWVPRVGGTHHIAFQVHDQKAWDEREARYLITKQELTEDCVNLQATLRRTRDLHHSAEADLREVKGKLSDALAKAKASDGYAGELERDLERKTELLGETLCEAEKLKARVEEAVADERRDAVTIGLLRSDKVMLEAKLRASADLLKKHIATIGGLHSKLEQEERLRRNALAALNINDGVMMDLRNQVADRDQIIEHLKKQGSTENGKTAMDIGDKIAALVGRHGFQVTWSGGTDGVCGLCRKVLTDQIHFTDGEMRAAIEAGP